MKNLLNSRVLSIALFTSAICRGQITITEYPIPTSNSLPDAITAGSDGNLWFTEHGSNKIGRITPAGLVTEFPVASTGPFLGGIAAGPDGNVWFTNSFSIDRITPSGVITVFPLPAPSSARGITAGLDGNLWFTDSDNDEIGRITPAGAITEFPLPLRGSQPTGIAVGPDGNIWFIENSKIGRITLAGVITEFPISLNGGATLISRGSDGNLWFGPYLSATFSPLIARMSPDGTLIGTFELPLGGSTVLSLSSGPDGNMWYGRFRSIGRVTPAGTITEFPVSLMSFAEGMAKGPDGNMWFTDDGTNMVGKANLPNPTVVRTPPYDFFAGCNSSTEVSSFGSNAAAVVDSDPIAGTLDVNVQALGLVADAKGQAGVGIVYISPLDGQVTVQSTIEVSAPPGLEVVYVTGIPKVGQAGIAGLTSSVFLSTTPPVDSIGTQVFSSLLTLPVCLPGVCSISHIFNPPKQFTFARSVPVSLGEQLRVCAGVQSEAKVTGLPGTLTMSKGLYVSVRVLNIKVIPQ